MKPTFITFAILIASALVQAEIKEPKPVRLHTDHYFKGFVKNFTPRITGGEEVEPHSLSYQVGLFIATEDGTAFCGGSLISTTTVLTAAHCGEVSESIQVILGAHKILEADEDTQVAVNAASIIIHPEWNSLLLQNDLAILGFSAPVVLNENIGLINLPSQSDAANDYAGQIALASGWGKDSDAAESISPVLRAVEVPIASNIACNLFYFGIIQDSHICAATDGGKSTCSGDSGGPLRSEQQTLIGVTSFGISFGCEIGWPAVFTRVTNYLNWIAENSDVVINT